MRASLAEAEPRVVITTSRGSVSACGLRSKRRCCCGSCCLSLCDELHEHLAVVRRAADQAREMLRHRHEAAAVVAQVEHELGRAPVLELLEGGGERGDRRLDEVAEVDVAHARRPPLVTAVCDTVGIVTSRLVSVALRSEPPGARHETVVE